jgi:beta-galactosidase
MATERERSAPAPVSTPELNIWRAPVDNDGFKLMPELSRRWAVGGRALERWRVAGLFDRPADELVEHRTSVEEDAAGSLHRHEVTVPESLTDLPRIGVTFTVPARFDLIRWFGRGPHENYPDRNRSAMLGVWEGPPDELPYLVPQEFGLRTDSRWVELVDATTGETVRIDVVEPHALHFSAVRHTAADLYEATELRDLRRDPGLVVCLDVAHRGLGTASCGPDVLPHYRLAAGTYRFAYRISRR